MTPLVRKHVRAFLSNARPTSPATAEKVLVLVNELVSNAARHTSGPVTIQLGYRPDAIDIVVSDSSTLLPQPRPYDFNGDGGFGWHLMELLADEVTVTVIPVRQDDFCLHHLGTVDTIAASAHNARGHLNTSASEALPCLVDRNGPQDTINVPVAPEPPSSLVFVRLRRGVLNHRVHALGDAHHS